MNRRGQRACIYYRRVSFLAILCYVNGFLVNLLFGLVIQQIIVIGGYEASELAFLFFVVPSVFVLLL